MVFEDKIVQKVYMSNNKCYAQTSKLEKGTGYKTVVKNESTPCSILINSEKELSIHQKTDGWKVYS